MIKMVKRICKNCEWWMEGITKIIGECCLEMEGKIANDTCHSWKPKKGEMNVNDDKITK